jgi:hypothetical protein
MIALAEQALSNPSLARQVQAPPYKGNPRLLGSALAGRLYAEMLVGSSE